LQPVYIQVDIRAIPEKISICPSIGTWVDSADDRRGLRALARAFSFPLYIYPVDLAYYGSGFDRIHISQYSETE
jgi:hypothetical protein